ncbi:MAG: YbgA family protein, partial [Nitrospirales bacterium]|nr:YbgA family protein [Nitrospirales bacterium]
HRGLVPLIVPVTMLRHYVRKYDEPYLHSQHYLNPHPAELMLRNHV